LLLIHNKKVPEGMLSVAAYCYKMQQKRRFHPWNALAIKSCSGLGMFSRVLLLASRQLHLALTSTRRLLQRALNQ
jgi:hypothetical protein